MSIDDTVYTEDITVVTTERGADLRGEKVEEPSTGETGDEAEDKPPFRLKFLEKHFFLGMLCPTNSGMRRVEKWTIFLCIIMLQLFTIGLFYDSGNDPEKKEEEENEEDKTIEDSLKEFGWKDMWIMIYSILIVTPIPILMAKLFTRP